MAIFDRKLRLEVPLFQRQYVWSQDEQWEPLWEDIARKFSEYLEGRKDAPIQFHGAMVLDQKQTPITHVEKRQVGTLLKLVEGLNKTAAYKGHRRLETPSRPDSSMRSSAGLYRRCSAAMGALRARPRPRPRPRREHTRTERKLCVQTRTQTPPDLHRKMS